MGFNSSILSIFLTISTCFFFHIQADKSFPFQRKIWAFWDQPLYKAPLVIQMCHEKISQIAAEQNWKFTLLSLENVQKYMPKYQQEFVEVNKRSQMQHRQNVADLVRFIILEEHGGIWVDLTTIFIYGLKWLDNLESFDALFSNKNGSIVKNPPEMILFYTANYQDRVQYRDEKTNSLVNFNPGYQIWFIAVKSKTYLIQEWKWTFIRFYQIPFEKLVQRFYNEKIYFRNIGANNYLTANMAIYYIIQKKQFILDNTITIYQKRDNINQVYKVWGLHAEYGPLFFFLGTVWDINSIMQNTVEQVQKQARDLRFFVKITQFQRDPIQKQFKAQVELAKKGQNFQQFLATNPTQEQCSSINFILEDSVVGRLIFQNQLALKLGIKPITKEQMNSWKQYCNNIQRLNIFKMISFQNIITKVITFFKHYFAGECARVEEIQLVFKKKTPTLQQRLIIFINSNAFIITLFSLATFILSVITIVTSVFSKYFKDIILNSSCASYTYPELVSDNYRIWLIIVHLGSTCIIATQMFLADTFGGKNQPFVILCTLSIGFLIRYLSQKKALETNAKMAGFNISDIKFLFDGAYGYCLAKVCFVMFEPRQQNLIFHSVLCGIVGPWLMKMKNDLKERLSKDIPQQQQQTTYLSQFLKIGQNYKIIILFYFCLLSIFPRFLYYTFHDQYLLQANLPYIPMIYVLVLSIYVTFNVVTSLFIDYSQNKPQTAMWLIQMAKLILISIIVVRFYWLRFYYIDKLHPVHRIFYEITFFMFIAILDPKIYQVNLNKSTGSMISENEQNKQGQTLIENSHKEKDHQIAFRECFQFVRLEAYIYLLVPLCYFTIGSFFGNYVFYKYFVQEWIIIFANIGAVIQYRKIRQPSKGHAISEQPSEVEQMLFDEIGLEQCHQQNNKNNDKESEVESETATLKSDKRKYQKQDQLQKATQGSKVQNIPYVSSKEQKK